MPELPEVEAVVRKLRPQIEGAIIRAVRVLRARATHPQSPDKLSSAAGGTIESVQRRGKNIVVRLSGGLSIRIHLRMTGNVTVLPSHLLHADTARVILALNDGRGIAFEDPRMLGTVQLHEDAELDDLLSQLGAEPLSDAFTPDLLIASAARSRQPVKTFLMDQSPIAGLGNIYAAESLFRARIHPCRPTCRIAAGRLTRLHKAIQAVLSEAIPQAIESYSRPDSHDGTIWRVYDREGQPCVECGSTIRRLKQGGRSTYYCGKCQR